MAVNLMVTETVLHQIFDELSNVVVTQALQTTRFKTPLTRLRNTLKCIEPVFYEYWRLINVLDRPQNETLMFIAHLKRGKYIVLKSSMISFRNQYQVLFHSSKLIRLNNELVEFFHKELQVKTASSVKSLIEINDSDDELDRLQLDFTTHVTTAGFISSNRYDQMSLKDEELTLNISNDTYSLPEFITQMDQLKALNVTSYNDYPSKLHNLSVIEALTNLTTVRFEHVSLPSMQPIFALKNLAQLTFVMCEIGDALMSWTADSHYTLPNLTNLELDSCYDLKQLPSGICDLVNLQKLSITNCHELDVLPNGLGDLSSLEILNLHCCTKLQELPESIGSLRNLSFVDVSDCLSLSVLPEGIGELCGLKVVKMNGCGGLQELPTSIGNLWLLEEVICDEETSYLWMDFETDIENLKINVVEDDRLESFMKIVQ